MEIHEGPRIAAGQRQVLVPGMVITVEPGVYGAGLYGAGRHRAGPSRGEGIGTRAEKTPAGGFGIRIEDMVLVTGSGGDVLTAASPKAWIEL